MSTQLRPTPQLGLRALEGARFAEAFFMGMSEVHQALEKITRLLDGEGIPYAVIGAMALNEYGFRRVTEDVDILLTRAGLDAFKAAHLGRGYVEKHPGSKGVRDTEHGVGIDFLLSGEYPGDGKPKSVRFPDPAEVAIAGGRLRLLPLSTLLELKLASGISAPHRMQDLADVLRMIRIRKLGRDMADEMDPYVRDRYVELWRTAQEPDVHEQE
jgi:hypothetical protein